MLYYCNKTRLGAQIPFNFGLLKGAERNNLAESIDATIKNWLDNTPKNQVANWVVRLIKF